MAAAQGDQDEHEYGTNKFGRSNRPITFNSRSRDLKMFTRPATSIPVSEISNHNDLSTQHASRGLSADAVGSTKTHLPAASIRSAYERAIKEEGLESGDEAKISSGPMLVLTSEYHNTSPSPAGRPRYINGGRANKENEFSRYGRSSDARKGNLVVGSASGSSESGSVRNSCDDTNHTGYVRRRPTYEEDRARLDAILRSQTPLFVKSEVSARIAETAHILHRKSSESSLDDEPPIRIPALWGTKSKAKYRWLERIIHPELADELEQPVKQQESDEDINWADAAASVPLPSIEAAPSNLEPTPPHSRSPSANSNLVSPQRSQLWDAELDFTAQSLQFSTSPQLKIRSSKLDHIRDREIESLSKRAVATSRLEDIRERNSEERSVTPEDRRVPLEPAIPARQGPQLVHTQANGTYPGKVAEAINSPAQEVINPEARALTEQEDYSVSSLRHAQREMGLKPSEVSKKALNDNPKRISLDAVQKGKGLEHTLGESMRRVGKGYAPDDSEQQIQMNERTILEEEGEPIPGTPITIFRNAAKSCDVGQGKQDFQQGHGRDDSYDTLRQLSRAMSPSPSPVPAEQETQIVKNDKNQVDVSTETKRLSTTITPPKSDIDPEERIAAEKSLFELPDSISVRAPSPTEDRTIEETPKPKAEVLSRATPIVSGAYIDTPAPMRIIPSKLESSDLGDAIGQEFLKSGINDHLRSPALLRSSDPPNEPGFSTASATPAPNPRIEQLRARKRQPVINTANPVSVKDDLRKIREEANIEDSTLEDFEDFFVVDPPRLDTDSTTILEPKVDLEQDEEGQPLTRHERERRLEMLAYDRMNKSLKTGLLSIRDAKRGIERLEDRVSASPEPKPGLGGNHNHGSPTLISPSPSGSIYYVIFPFPRLWSWDPTRRLGIRLTWLGIIFSLIFSWIIAETITCEIVCHPTYATTNNWSPSDPFWGGALPTLANRLSGGSLSLLSKVCCGYYKPSGVFGLA